MKWESFSERRTEKLKTLFGSVHFIVPIMNQKFELVCKYYSDYHDN